MASMRDIVLEEKQFKKLYIQCHNDFLRLTQYVYATIINSEQYLKGKLLGVSETDINVDEFDDEFLGLILNKIRITGMKPPYCAKIEFKIAIYEYSLETLAKKFETCKFLNMDIQCQSIFDILFRLCDDVPLGSTYYLDTGLWRLIHCPRIHYIKEGNVCKFLVSKYNMFILSANLYNDYYADKGDWFEQALSGVKLVPKYETPQAFIQELYLLLRLERSRLKSDIYYVNHGDKLRVEDCVILYDILQELVERDKVTRTYSIYIDNISKDIYAFLKSKFIGINIDWQSIELS